MSFAYADPLEVTSPNDCFFYHTTDLPEFGTVEGHWDLRDCVDAYLGNYDFSGKRALDLGAASGFLTFAMEKREAEVVSFDLDDGANWNIVPHYALRDKLAQMRRDSSAVLVRLKRAYWLTHRLYRSRAQAYYGNIYSLPKSLGEFDVVYYGMIVGHLRDVYEALYQGARLCRETMIVTSTFEVDDTPRATFIPSADQLDGLRLRSWWKPTTGLMNRMLGTLGFQVVDVVESTPIVSTESGLQSQRPKCQAIVATRIS